jgi:hypothetical protein
MILTRIKVHQNFSLKNCQAYFTPWKMQQSIWATSNPFSFSSFLKYNLYLCDGTVAQSLSFLIVFNFSLFSLLKVCTHAVSACGKRSALCFANTYLGLD